MIFIILLFGFTVISSFWLIPRVLSRTSIGHFLQNRWRFLEECFHSHQFYKIPKFNHHMQENQLFHKILTYLNSLPSAGDLDYVNLFSAYNNPNEITLLINNDQMFPDVFLGSRVYWQMDENCFVLKIRRKEKRRILSSYLQHVCKTADEIEQKRKELRLYLNAEKSPEKNGRWISTPFKHPATIDTAMIDSDLKNKVKTDLELFLKSKSYYHRLGRVWKRSYLLYGPSGTGKSSFIAGMAKFLSYDVYDVDMSKVTGDSDLKLLLLQTTNKSLIVIEDLDRFLAEKEKSKAVSLSGVLNFMDGIICCCGEERVMVFTVSNKDHVDPTVMRPGRIDFHIHFPLCDFSSFKNLASSHLGIKEHKLFPQVEEIFQAGASLSPAEIGEIMISNRGSPTRALKTVINALQTNSGKTGTGYKPGHDYSGSGLPRAPRNLSHSGSIDGLVDLPSKLMHSGSTRTVDEASDHSGVFCMDGFHTGKELKNLYGLLKNRSRRREGSMDLDGDEKVERTM
ncbi:putative AAA+ ATPase domain, ATPase, AAA-type, core, AAA-type ATPase domain-containing protein [Helianthus annuus]|nr:putative AAA+ ATPase domain, ATPase, AAA-type, core, AAA-type ATPase domain-containing protein [Helianthus annuus]